MSRWRGTLTYFLLSLFLIPALWPLTHPGLPRANDHLPHYFRAVQLETLVRAGDFLPRWAPDLVFGYGYPVFNFFPYLAHYGVVILSLCGFEFLTAYKLACGLVLLLSGWSAYALGRELLGERAGFITGLAYALSPYVLYDLHTRGSLPENLALALMPLALLNLRRAAHGQRLAGAWAALSLAASLLAHNGITLQAMPFILAYAGFEALSQSWPAARQWPTAIRQLFFISLPFILAASLSAFFALPALLESALVQINRGMDNGGMLYTNFFLSLSTLLSWPRLPVDPDLLNPPIAWSLPHVALVFACGALARYCIFQRTQPGPRATVLFFSALTMLGAFLMHPAAQWVWDNVYLLRITLFPFRLLGPVSLFIAICAGSLFAEPFWKGWRGNWAYLTAALALVLNGLPYASPVFEAVVAQPTLQDVANFELPPDFIGTTTVGEYLPRTVQTLPADVTERRNLAARTKFLAEGAQVTYTPRGPNTDTFQITVSQPATFIYQQFYFPGWQATLDGQTVTPRVLDDGRMAVELPAGSHTLSFEFGNTPVRMVGNVLTMIGLLVVGYWLLRNWTSEQQTLAESNSLPSGALLSTALLLCVARPFLYEAGYTPLLQRGLTPEGLRGVAHPVNHNFADEVTLLGWESTPRAVNAEANVVLENDAAFTLDLYVKANRPLGIPYGFDVKLVDANGFVWNEPEMPRPQNWRFTPGTDFWPTEQYIVLSQNIRLLAGTPPGQYWVRVAVFAFYNLHSLGTVDLGPFTINTPSRRACAEPNQWPAPNLQVAQFNLTQAAPGERVLLNVCWQGQPPRWPILLQDVAGRNRLPETFTGAFSSTWPPETVARGQLRLRLPADLETGAYQWVLETESRLLPIGTLNVTAPARTFTPPATGQQLEADLGLATLFAAEAPAILKPGDVLPVKLVWRADELFEETYSVFVHVLNSEGSLVAQSDGGPANWARPTTCWLPGEYIFDERLIQLPADLPAGTYTLYAGLYRPADGQRLLTTSFPDGRVPLISITIAP
jgi:hypothetical protein